VKAVFFDSHGPIEVLRFGQIPDPVLRENEALVKVHYCALNRLDVWVRLGWKGLKLEFPHVTGSDVVGELVEVNGNWRNFKRGETVLINPGIVTKIDEFVAKGEPSLSPHYKILGEQVRGGLAEYCVIPISNVIRLNPAQNPVHVCASILCGMTVWRMLFTRAKLKPSETVLIVGAGGGVNSLTIQIVKSIGCYAIVIAGGREKAQKARELGADFVIDYKKHPDWALEVLAHTKGYGVDLVVDNVGENTIQQSILACKRGGRIVTVGNTSGWNLKIDNRYIFVKQIQLIGSTMGSEFDLIESQNFLSLKKITPVIHQVFEFKDAIKAIKLLESGKHFGKIVIRVS